MSRIDKFIDIKSRLVAEVGAMKVIVNGHGIAYESDENVLERVSGDQCTTLQIY